VVYQDLVEMLLRLQVGLGFIKLIYKYKEDNLVV
jgi:hypothetical protein